MWKTTASLLGVFAPLSFATVGGGQSIIADLQRQAVTVHHWLTRGQFTDLYAISRMAPGPGSLFATLIGWHVGGISGAMAATIGVFGPTILLTYAIARVWSQYKDMPWQRSLETGLKPVAAGMILASVFVLVEGMNGGLATRGIALVATIVMLLTRINPLALLAMGAASFAALHAVFHI